MIGKPLPLDILFCKREEGLDNVGEIKDELLVKVAEFHERLYHMDKSQGGPFMNDAEFDWIHRDSFLSHYQA